MAVNQFFHIVCFYTVFMEVDLEELREQKGFSFGRGIPKNSQESDKGGLGRKER